MLEVDDITVSYGEITALHGVSLTTEEGEIVTVIGANGAGKTTLLRTISGLNRPSSGGVTFQGQDIHTLSPDEIARRGVIQVPEGRHIFPDLTVKENLRLGTFARRDGEQVADLDHVYDIFPRLMERTQQRGKLLSGGEQQMLAIGRALMSDPDLLLLDEPSLGLAPQIIHTVVRTQFQQSRGESTCRTTEPVFCFVVLKGSTHDRIRTCGKSSNGSTMKGSPSS